MTKNAPKKLTAKQLLRNIDALEEKLAGLPSTGILSAPDMLKMVQALRNP